MLTTPKQAALEIIRQLPDEVTLGEILLELYFRQKIGAGLDDLENYHTLTHDEAKAKLAKWLE